MDSKVGNGWLLFQAVFKNEEYNHEWGLNGTLIWYADVTGCVSTLELDGGEV